jgi:hypothetical protein
VHDHGQTFSLERNLEVAPDHEEEDAAHGRVVIFVHAPDAMGMVWRSRVLAMVIYLLIFVYAVG